MGLYLPIPFFPCCSAGLFFCSTSNNQGACSARVCVGQPPTAPDVLLRLPPRLPDWAIPVHEREPGWPAQAVVTEQRMGAASQCEWQQMTCFGPHGQALYRPVFQQQLVQRGRVGGEDSLVWRRWQCGVAYQLPQAHGAWGTHH